MRKKNDLARDSNAKIAIIFFIFLGVIVIVSLAFKGILIIRQGQFDESKRFNLIISDTKNSEAMSISANSKSIAIFKLPKNITSDEAGRFLAIPIDSYILSKSLNLNQKADSLFLQSLLNYKNLQTNFTIIDIVKILFLTRTIAQNADIKNITPDLDIMELDKAVRLISDELIEKDNQTIQIINGTDIAGLGNRLARLVTNMGGDVVIVATSDTPHKKSTISYIDQKTYTVERLSKVLGYEIIKSAESAIFDITITIGKDKAAPSAF